MAEPATLSVTEAPGFQAFYEDALPRVYGYFLSRCSGDRAVAEDLTQETFLAGVRELRRGTAVQSPLPWILGIARHKLIDHYRRREREDRRLTAVASETSAEGPLTWDDDVASRRRALEALAAVAGTQRSALVLHYVDGFPVTEVAQILGKSEHATESLLARGRQSFRRAYGEACDG